MQMTVESTPSLHDRLWKPYTELQLGEAASLCSIMLLVLHLRFVGTEPPRFLLVSFNAISIEKRIEFRAKYCRNKYKGFRRHPQFRSHGMKF